MTKQWTIYMVAGALMMVACGDDAGSGTGTTTGTSGGLTPTTTAPPPTTTTPTPSASGTTTIDESTSDDGAVDSTGTSDGPVVPDAVFESIAGGAFDPFDGYEARGRAHLVRTIAGETIVELHIEGLEPNTEYPTHVHALPCDVDLGGPHYQIEPGGAVDDVNEIWPVFTTDADGVGQTSLTSDHLVRGEAQAIVVHDPNADNARMACASLSFDPSELVEFEGSFAPFAAAEAVDEDIAGTARMEIRPTGTTVSVDVSGLSADENYMAHVHQYPCDVVDAGAHYQRVPGGPVDADNELWPSIAPDDAGAASDSFDVDHIARGDAQSIVIHRMVGDQSPRVACASLVRGAYPEVFTTQGVSMVLPGGAGDYDDLTASIMVERDLAGLTRARLDVTGAPAGEYPVHVHNRTCSMGEGGAHYKLDPSIDDTVEANEIWLGFTAADDGAGSASIEVEHTARPEALSIVVHDPDDSTIRVACTDLDNLP